MLIYSVEVNKQNQTKFGIAETNICTVLILTWLTSTTRHTHLYDTPLYLPHPFIRVAYKYLYYFFQGEKFLYLKDDNISRNSVSDQISPSRTPCQTVQQSPNRTPQRQLSPSPTHSPVPINSFPNIQQRTSSNLGRPTDLSNGLPGGGPKPYQNGLNDPQRSEDKSLSPRHKSPVPYPKPNQRTSPPTGGMASNQTNGRLPDTQINNSPRVLSPPRSHGNTPRVMSPPRNVNRREGLSGSPSHHRPVSSTMSVPSSQLSPVHNKGNSHNSKLVSQATAPTLTPPTSTLTGRGTSKRKLEISGPVNLTTMSNGGSIQNSAHPIIQNSAHPITIVASSVPNSINDRMLFDRYTSELENIGIAGSYEVTSLGSIGDLVPKDPSNTHRPTSSGSKFK